MSGSVFFHRTDIEEDDFTPVDAVHQGLLLDGLQRVRSFLELAQNRIDFGKPVFSQRPQRLKEVADCGVRKPICHKQPCLLAFYQTRTMQNAEMLRSVGYAQAGFVSQAFDGAWSLAQKVEQFEPCGAGNRFAESSELLIKVLLEAAGCIHIVFNCIVEYLDASCQQVLNRMDRLPLLNHPLDEPTTFTPEALLAAVRAERGLAAESPPAVCVLDFDGDVTDWLIAEGRARQWKSWACFHTTMFTLEVEGNAYGIVPRTIGGPYAVLVAEQLAASGAQLILGLTSAGRVLTRLPIPSLVIATSVVRDEGTSYHYLPPSESVDAPRSIPSWIESEFRRLDLPVSRGALWTTDAPYRETQMQLDRYAAAGVLAVEMQAASLFSFAACHEFPVGVVAHVTNAVDHRDDPFNKGAHLESVRIVEAMCKAGRQFLARGRDTAASPGESESEEGVQEYAWRASHDRRAALDSRSGLWQRPVVIAPAFGRRSS